MQYAVLHRTVLIIFSHRPDSHQSSDVVHARGGVARWWKLLVSGLRLFADGFMKKNGRGRKVQREWLRHYETRRCRWRRNQVGLSRTSAPRTIAARAARRGDTSTLETRQTDDRSCVHASVDHNSVGLMTSTDRRWRNRAISAPYPRIPRRALYELG